MTEETIEKIGLTANMMQSTVLAIQHFPDMRDKLEADLRDRFDELESLMLED